ncbi:MAG: 50S ribosomal protein L25/general stress protein Ctc [Pseudomonadota bacterium]|nr:50S ribosomal protein L25/general stress protein Ctc [Pseudomonadota bacterium]
MSEMFELHAEPRNDTGKGASRRLRRQGRVPAILYGGDKPPQSLSFEQNALRKQLENEAFYSHVLTVHVGGRTEQAILRDLQRHPYKPLVSHLDLQRVIADAAVRVRVPLHFINEGTARGVKQEGGKVSHLMIDVEVSCLPRDIPEFIEVDLADLGLGDSIHLSQLKLPQGVEIVQLAHGAEHDLAVVNIHHGRLATEEEAAAAEGEGTPGAAPGAGAGGA